MQKKNTKPKQEKTNSAQYGLGRYTTPEIKLNKTQERIIRIESSFKDEFKSIEGTEIKILYDLAELWRLGGEEDIREDAAKLFSNTKIGGEFFIWLFNDFFANPIMKIHEIEKVATTQKKQLKKPKNYLRKNVYSQFQSAFFKMKERKSKSEEMSASFEKYRINVLNRLLIQCFEDEEVKNIVLEMGRMTRHSITSPRFMRKDWDSFLNTLFSATKCTIDEIKAELESTKNLDVTQKKIVQETDQPSTERENMDEGTPNLDVDFADASDPIALGHVIKNTRLSAGLSQGKLESKSKISVSTISRIETGKGTTPNLDTLKDIAEATDTEIQIRFVPKKHL